MKENQVTQIKICSCLVPLCHANPTEKDIHTFPSSALNIKAKDSEGCDPLPLSLCRVAYEIGPSNIHFILTQRHLKRKSLALTFKLMEILKKKRKTQSCYCH